LISPRRPVHGNLRISRQVRLLPTAQAHDAAWTAWATRLAHLRLAGAHRLAVDMDRAGAAQTRAATELRTGHLQVIADEPQQRHFIGNVNGVIASIDVDRSHLSSPPFVRVRH
jgi:hypothetical protein